MCLTCFKVLCERVTNVVCPCDTKLCSCVCVCVIADNNVLSCYEDIFPSLSDLWFTPPNN